MKKLSLFFFFITSISVFVAQPILTINNFIPNNGDLQLFYVGDANAVEDPTIGANVIFDYSGIAGDGTTQTQYVVDPSTTTHSSSFPSSTHADTSAGIPISKNYSQTEATDSLMNIGVVADIDTYGTVIVQYNQDAEKLMEFPFNYGMNFTDDYAGEFTLESNSIKTDGRGSATVTADGWGKLLLPFGVSIDSVLRVKTVENLVTDKIIIPFIGTIDPITIRAEYINYYKPSISKFPLLSFISGSYTQDNNNLDSSKSILSQYPLNAVSVNSLNKISNSFNVFPNPSDGVFTTLSFDLETDAIIKADLTDNLGKQVLSIFDNELGKGNHQIKIKNSSLSKGLYFVNINVDDKKITKKLIIK